MRPWLVAGLAALSTSCAMVLGLEDKEPFPPGSSTSFDPPVVVASGQRGVLGVTTDASRIYFVAEIGNTLGAAEKRANAPVALLLQGLNQPRHVVVDDVRVYVGQAGKCSDDNAGVVSVLKDGTSRSRGGSFNCGDNLTSMAFNGTFLFGVRAGAIVISWPTSLQDPQKVAEGVDNITGLAAQGADVYFTSGTKGTVNAVRPPNPTVVAVAQNQPSPQDVAVDERFVYWLNGDGAVMKLDRATPGAPPTPLATGQPSPRRIAQFGENVYFTCGDGSVRLVSKAGGEARVIASGQQSPTGLAVDLQGVYWTNRADDTVMMAVRR